jgi:hypothetical protein
VLVCSQVVREKNELLETVKQLKAQLAREAREKEQMRQQVRGGPHHPHSGYHVSPVY